MVRGFARQYAGRGEEAGEAAEYFGPLVSTSRELAGELAEDEETLTRFLVDSSRLSGALADRRGELSAARRQRQRRHARDRGAERAARARARAPARDAAPGDAHLREPARDARRPRRAGGRGRAGHARPGAVPARAAPAAARGRGRRCATCASLVDRAGPANDLLDATRTLPAVQRAATPAFAALDGRAAAAPARGRLRPPLRARAHGLVPRLRPGRRQLRRQRPLRARAADLQPVRAQEAVARLVPIPGSRRFEGYRTGQLRRCPGAASSRRPTARRPWRDVAGALDCDPTQVPPGP